MNKLKEFLVRFGLSKHYSVFRANSVDLEILPDLAEADLKELGLDLGDRKRMMRALKALANEGVPATPGFAEATQSFETHPGTASLSDSSGERLHLTMMFVDLVGSTALSNELDLEAYREVLHAYQLCCLEVIRSQHGHVAQFVGDGVTAYFGYPTAEEDDADRAVLAGLDICDNLSALATQVERPLLARVGIATGDVVVAAGAIGESLVFGETPNLAARIQSEAMPGTVAISDRTRQLLSSSIECEWLGTHALKGFSDPIGIWSVRAAGQAELRFQARQRGEILPIVDRVDEMRLLEGRWQTACSGTTQTVMLSGDAGIGKSRIVEALTDRIKRDQSLRLSFQCSPNHQGSAFFPLISFINYIARIERSDHAPQRAEKLKRFSAGWFTDVYDALTVFSNLLAVPIEDGSTSVELSPERLKERLQTILVDLIIRLSERRPILLLFEDLHWIDPSTEELIDLLIARVEKHRVLILCTARPGYRDRWTGLARVTSLSISRLDDHFSHELICNVLSGGFVSPQMREQIIAKSDGVPLFLEEMTRMVRQRLDQPPALRDDDELLALPSTLKDLLRAKIDALVTAREVVPICAAVGRSILPSMIQAITGLSFEASRAQLDYLAEVQILVPRGNHRDRSYAFRHALIQDAAYELMLPSRARALHRRISEVLVDGFPDLVAQQPDMLAQHYERAEMAVEARDAWRDASVYAARRSATEETIRHLESALRENEKVDDKATRENEEIALRKMFNVALNTRAFGSRQVLENFQRLHTLLLRSGAVSEDAFLALHVQFGAQLMLGDAANALDMCEDLDRIGDQIGDPTTQALATHNRAMATFMLGEFAEAIELFDRAFELRARSSPPDILRYHAADIRTVDIAMRCWAKSLAGENPAQVRSAIEAATTIVEAEEHEFSQCFALSVLATAYKALGDTEEVLALAEKALKISTQHRFEYWDAWNKIVRGWAEARSGEPTVGIAKLEAGLEDYLAIGSTQITNYARTLLADAYLSCGDVERGLATIEAVKRATESGSISYHLGIVERVEASLRSMQAIQSQRPAR